MDALLRQAMFLSTSHLQELSKLHRAFQNIPDSPQKERAYRELLSLTQTLVKSSIKDVTAAGT
jgi:hypothetical protein